MTELKIITAAALALALAPVAAGACDVLWYIGHLGKETCVPLDDIGQHSERLYYGSGSMHTLNDFERWARSRAGGSGACAKAMPRPSSTGT
jgi:hypothetical protein